MRLFIAINFDEETIQNIIAVQRRLQEFGHSNLSRPENLHLTLVFLGEVAHTRTDAVRKAMDSVTIGPMELTFDRTGSFRRDGGDIWWLGLAKNKALLEMQTTLFGYLIDSGFCLENRSFSPHITLARGVRLAAKPDCAALFGRPFTTQVGAISLMRSERIGGWLTYTEQYRKE